MHMHLMHFTFAKHVFWLYLLSFLLYYDFLIQNHKFSEAIDIKLFLKKIANNLLSSNVYLHKIP